MASLQCPLGWQAFLTLEKPMCLQHLTAIEEHVAANCPNCPHPPLKDIFFTDDSIKGTTPLLMACYYGEIASVKRIVESWGVDVNLAAAYYFDRLSFYGYSKIEKASALFVAASACKLDIVRYLVGRGAIVSAKTSDEADSYFDGLTPLYGAFLDCRTPRRREQSRAEGLEERSAIVRVLLECGADPSTEAFHPKDGRAMRTSYWCGIATITALIDHGLAVNHRTADGSTLLTDLIRPSCTEEELVAVAQLLLDNGADVNIPGRWGLTPIIRAAYHQKWALLDLFLERCDISRKDKIDALELAGAINLENLDGESAPLFPKAFECWRRSLHLRLDDSDGRGSITKIVPTYQETGRVVEWATSEDLEVVIQSSEFKLQSFLVRSRILSAISWDAFNKLRFVDFSTELVEQCRFGDLLIIHWSLLEKMQRFHVQEEGLCSKSLLVVKWLVVTLKHLRRNDDPLLNKATIKTSLELLLATDRFHFDSQQLYRYSYSTFDLTALLANRPQLLNDENLELLSILVCRDNGKLLLHLACKIGEDNPNINRLATLRLLLRVGANPDAANDDNGDRPHHRLAWYNPTDEAAARLLLDAGAFLGRMRNDGRTAADLWKASQGLEENVDAAATNMPSWLRDYDPSVPKLKFQCGRIIRSYRVHCLRLPLSLRNFVEMQQEENEETSLDAA